MVSSHLLIFTVDRSAIDVITHLSLLGSSDLTSHYLLDPKFLCTTTEKEIMIVLTSILMTSSGLKFYQVIVFMITG